MAKLVRELDGGPGTEAYGQRQFDWRARQGMLRKVIGLDVFEVGEGHRGISCFVAIVEEASASMRSIGAIGAALATMLGWVVTACVLYYFAQRRFAISYDWPPIGSFVLVACMCVRLSNVVQPMSRGGRLAGSVGVSLTYPLVLFDCLPRSCHERQRTLHLPALAAPHQAGQNQ